MVGLGVDIPYDVIFLPEWSVSVIIKTQCYIKKVYDPVICFNFKFESIPMKQSDQFLYEY